MKGIKMMMKEGLLFQQQQRPAVDIDNISNLTSTSGTEATVSSGNKNIDIGAAQQYYGQPGQSSQPVVKRKRNLPGNPDPDAEVIALSPKTLMATNRFLCEICNKGFQRDQNLQLHRRGHNLPWKLKQRSNKEVIKKKVYVCPETSCVHHEPSRALGDLTGIKKHFCRKHGEKNWKCDKCSKKYAVQSDWKAHSKTCGTREYRCDCGTLFSRRDSFITHRAFCDALAEESGRANISSSANPSLSHHQQLPSGNSSAVSHLNQLQSTQFINNLQQDHHPFPLKKEQQNFNLNPEIPPWLSTSVEHLSSSSSSNLIFPTRLNQNFTQIHHDQNPNPNNTTSMGPTFPPYQPAITHHMSATALLQKAAQMGSTRSSNTSSSPALLRPHQTHMSDNSSNNNNNSNVNFGLNLSARDPHMASTVFAHNLSAFGIKAAASATTIGATSSSTTTTNGVATATSGVVPPSSSSILHDMMKSLSSETGFEGTSIEDSFGGFLNSSKKDFEHSRNLHETLSMKTNTSKNDLESSGGGGGCINIVGEGLTRDFLGLRRMPQNNILNIDGIRNYMNTSSEHQNQPQNPWQGN